MPMSTVMPIPKKLNIKEVSTGYDSEFWKNTKSQKRNSVVTVAFFNSKRVINLKFDIIFIDPPYKELNVNTLLEKLISRKILKKNGIIIIHRHKKDKLEINKKIKILDVRNYGVSKVYFCS